MSHPSFVSALPLPSCGAGARAACARSVRKTHSARVARGARMVAAAPPRRPPPASPAPAPGELVSLSAAADFVSVQAGAAAAGRVVYVLFHAGYCRACKAVAPKFAALAAEYPHATFVSVLLEDGRELAARLGIRAVPTVQVYQGAAGKTQEFHCAPKSLPRLRATVAALSPHAHPPASAAPPQR